MEQRELLESIVTDLERLAENYQRAGLLEESSRVKAARHLIGDRDEILAFRRLFLLTNALLRNVVGKQVFHNGQQLKHVTVFGGTQVGKSTCINVLLGSYMAQVHHTGGFTRHAQGFVPPDAERDVLFGGNPFTFRGFTQVPPDKLDKEILDQYSVQQLSAHPYLSRLVIWDTPDCDSVESSRYMPALVEALTLADVVVYVTSKEKYAVDQILAWVVMLADAGIPLVGCLNLTPRHQQLDVLTSQKQALETVAKRHGRPIPDLKMVAFPFVDAETSEEVCSVLCDPQFAPGNALRETVSCIAESPIDQARRVEKAISFMKDCLPTILEPAKAELEALKQWKVAIESGLEQFKQDYRKNYLDNPERYDAFARVSLQILDLLDPPVPGLKRAIKIIRAVLSLPARIIIFGGKKMWKLTFGGSQETKEKITPAEVQTYIDAHAHFLYELVRVIRDQRSQSKHHPFWDELDAKWDTQMETLQREFQDKLAEHWKHTEQRITRTAEEIFQELEKRPALLNSLRASRFVADAAAIIISVKTGGAGDIVHDILLAPALMTVTEAISRSITEGYVESRRKELRDILLHDNRQFVDHVYRPSLMRLLENAMQHAGFLKLDPEMIHNLPKRVDLLSAQIGHGTKS